MANPNINKVNFSSKSKEELIEINKQSGKKSEGAKRRWFREKNPDIASLMEYYKNGSQLEVMEKYMNDNEKFMDLYKNAETNEEKRKILRDYQTFNLKVYELIVGSKIGLSAQIDVGQKLKEAEIRFDSVKRACHMLLQEAKFTRLYEWQKKFTPKQIQEMLKHIEEYMNEKTIEERAKKNYMLRTAIKKSLEKGININEISKEEIEEMNAVDFSLPKLSAEERFDSAENLQRIKAEIDKQEEEQEEEPIIKKEIPKKNKTKKKEEENEEEIYL